MKTTLIRCIALLHSSLASFLFFARTTSSCILLVSSFAYADSPPLVLTPLVIAIPGESAATAATVVPDLSSIPTASPDLIELSMPPKKLVVDLLALLKVSDVLDETDSLVLQELRNLRAIPGATKKYLLNKIDQNMQSIVSQQGLESAVIDYILKSMTTQELLLLERRVVSVELSELRQIQKSDLDRVEFEAYKYKASTEPLRNERLALLGGLDELAGYSHLQSSLRIEIRKNLLKQITEEFRKEAASEALLDEQLAQYHEQVRSEMKERTRFHLLYAFRKTPSKKIQQYKHSLQEEAVRKFLYTTELAIESYFKNSRS